MSNVFLNAEAKRKAIVPLMFLFVPIKQAALASWPGSNAGVGPRPIEPTPPCRDRFESVYSSVRAKSVLNYASIRNS